MSACRYLRLVQIVLWICTQRFLYLQAATCRQHILAGTLYEKARQRHGDRVTCKGTDCFQVVFLINAGLAVIAVVTSVLLWQRTRGLYHKVIEVTKAERAKRGLQVRRSIQMHHSVCVRKYSPLQFIFEAHVLLWSCEAALKCGQSKIPLT